jgi:hypothetical protein
MSLLDSVLSQGFDRSVPSGRDDAGRFTKAVRVRCSQCEAAVINGVACHETGCPNIVHECRGCNNTVSRPGQYCEDCQ